MWTGSGSTGARDWPKCGACSGPARRCRAILIRRRSLLHRRRCAGRWMRCSSRRDLPPDTSSTWVTASGPTLTPTPSRASSTTYMSEARSSSEARDFAATATAYFRELQARLCGAFEGFEPVSRFEKRSWTKPAGHRLQGGGEARLMRGAVFEKVGVNVSHVWGILAPEARGQVAGAKESDGRFVACGISLVAHMMNPYVPAVHMNLRYLSTSSAWFGGGSDLTPTFPFEEDTAEFHAALREACESYRPGTYAQLKAWCDRYFYLPHRQEPRGVG